MRSARVAMALLLIAIIGGGCGGGGGGSSSSSSSAKKPPPPPSGSGNVQPINVTLGPEGNYPNGVFIAVTLCVPGTSKCQTINNVLVDTGSFGLRILSSALKLALPKQTARNGSPVGECAFFVNDFTWGPVEGADVKMAGEVAGNLPLQVIGASGFHAPPGACTSSGTPPVDTLQGLGANGILGVGSFVQDCGQACTATGSSNSGMYFTCGSAGCSITAESLSKQVQNPVPQFSSDNNGVVVELPKIVAGGAKTAIGSLIFGIGTEANNTLGSTTIFTLNDTGNFTTVYNGNTYSASFLDSGSNGIFFLSPAFSGMPECSHQAGFYCPGTAQNFVATTVGVNAASESVSFSIANANRLFASGNAAFNNLGGPFVGAFDWGLPFFYGRNVFVAIDGQDTPGGPGPYVAY